MSASRLPGMLASLVLLACGAAWSQQYPSKPVRVVVVFPPGGATDIVSRIVFQKVGEQLNQQFLIDNRAGASGMIGGAIGAFVLTSIPGEAIRPYVSAYLLALGAFILWKALRTQPATAPDPGRHTGGLQRRTR